MDQRSGGANDSVENYADHFTIGLRNDEIREFDSKWDGILLSMTEVQFFHAAEWEKCVENPKLQR